MSAESKEMESNPADLGHVGQHCAYDNCNRLDFLPIKCYKCSLLFCKEHATLNSHKCPAIVDRQLDDEKTPPAQHESRFYKCSFDECNADYKEIVEIICDHCKLNFCTRHRFQTDHKCAQLAAKSKQQQQLDTKPKDKFVFEVKTNVSEKNASLAAKVALMKLKQTALGPKGLSEQLKYFCFVQHETSKKPFFFSTVWPVGRCIDFLGEKLNITGSSSTCLKLFLLDNQLDTSSSIETLLAANVLTQGATLELRSTQ